MSDRENCNKYFGLNTPTGLTEDQCIQLDNKYDVKFTKPGFFSKAAAKRNGKPFDLNSFKSSYEAEQKQAKLFRLEMDAKEQAMKMAPVQPIQPIQPIQQVQPIQPAPVKQLLPKEKSSFYEDFKNGKNWIQCKEGQPGCVPYSQLYVDDFSGERSCNIAVVNNGRENVVYDGTGKTQMTLEKKCEKKRGPLRGGKRTRRSHKSKRKTR